MKIKLIGDNGNAPARIRGGSASHEKRGQKAKDENDEREPVSSRRREGRKEEERRDNGHSRSQK